MKRQFQFVAAGGVMIVLGWAKACAAKTGFADLIGNSPFGAQAGATAEFPAVGQPELRGVVVEDDNYLFCLYDPIARISTWVPMNEPSGIFAIRSYDAANDCVTIAYKGRAFSLVLKRAKVVLVAPLTPSPASGMDTPNPRAVDPSAARSSSVEDSPRTVLIREEIRRRRSFRQQSARPPEPSDN